MQTYRHYAMAVAKVFCVLITIVVVASVLYWPTSL